MDITIKLIEERRNVLFHLRIPLATKMT